MFTAFGKIEKLEVGKLEVGNLKFCEDSDSFKLFHVYFSLLINDE